MSSVWREVGGVWQPLTIPEGLLSQAAAVEVVGLRFLRFGTGNDRGAALLLPPGVAARVNGRPVLAGLRVLEHKDEVIFGRSRLFYSAESTPIVVVFCREEGVRSPTCPLCRGPVRDGDQAVQCPGCGRWFHQTDAAEGKPAKPCWTYAPTCRFCNHPTALGGEAGWRPEMEEGHGR
ncbi:MAG TPA: hypothetical protein VKA46_11225 [Gemmataceae bacterium]|nr:hypothetical protein [Gemmataceae bacterium]